MKRIIITVLAALMLAMTPNFSSVANAATKTEQVTASTDPNPVVGTYKGHKIRQGKKGGLYYWTTTKKGENAGKVRKGYLTKSEKEEFYREHPNVKRPTNN